MTENEKEKLVRSYAAHEITWRGLREQGFADYVEVLVKLAELGLRLPIAPVTGPNVEARQRGRAMLRETLNAHK